MKLRRYRTMLEKDGTSSLRKAIGILKCFSEERTELSMTEVTHMTRLPPGTASRMLNALVEEHLLERGERDKLYRLGVHCLRMGKIARKSGALRTCVLPFMERLRDCFNETVSLYVRQDYTRVCYAQCETKSALRRSIPVGSILPLAAGAAGRCLLAWMPEAFIGEAMRELRPYTENTILEEKEIRTLLERTRQELYSVSRAEREKGVTAVAVPLFDAKDSVCASLSISGPDMRFSEQNIEEMVLALKKTALDLSEILSGGNQEKYGKTLFPNIPEI
jgi:DNA-binding IclR family transcriptional regulator